MTAASLVSMQAQLNSWMTDCWRSIASWQCLAWLQLVDQQAVVAFYMYCGGT